MNKKITRRRFLKTTGTGLAGIIVANIAPPFVRRTEAATATLRFLAAENVTGNWSPYRHTNLAQMNVEEHLHGHLLMHPGYPDKDPTYYELKIAESVTEVTPYIREFKLHKGLKWHDGTDVTAEDVKATAEYASEPGTIGAGFFTAPMKGKVIDKYTVQLSSEESGVPMPTALDLLHFYFKIVKAQDIADGSIEKRPVGCGPFKFVAQEGESTIMEAFDGYVLGRPKIDRLIFTYVGDAVTRMMSLLSGECEFIERLEGEQYNDLKKGGKVTTVKTASIENHFLHFRCQKPPFNDVRLRKAVAHAIDRSVIIDVLGNAGTWNYDMIPEGKVGFNKDAKLPEYNPAKTQELLAQAGFPKGKGLPEIEFITSVGFYPKTKEYGEVITAMLQEQGFPVKMSAHEVAAWNARIYKPDQGHIVDLGWAAGGPSPWVHIGFMWNPTGEQGGLVTAWKDEEMAKIWKKAQRALTVTEMGKILKEEYFPKLREILPSVAIYRHVLLHAHTKKLKGVYVYPSGALNLEKAYMA